MLKRIIAKLEDVDEGYRSLYTKKGDQFVLEVDGLPDVDAAKKKVDEFRTNNTRLAGENEQLTASLKKLEDMYQDVNADDIAAMRTLVATLESDKERKLIQEGKVDEVVQMRTVKMRDDFDTQITAKGKALTDKEAENVKLRATLGNHVIDKSVQAGLDAAGHRVRPGAMMDVLSRARESFQIGDDGEILAKDRTGKALFGKDGSPLTVTEFASDLVGSAKFLFESAKGSGAGGGNKGGGTDNVGKTIDVAGDAKAFGESLEDIASGKKTVAGSELEE